MVGRDRRTEETMTRIVQIVETGAPPIGEDAPPATMERGYYVTVFDRINNAGAGRHGVCLGPFRSLADAQTMVEPMRDAAEDADPFAAFYAFGLSSIGSHRPGLQNARLGLTLDADGFLPAAAPSTATFMARFGERHAADEVRA